MLHYDGFWKLGIRQSSSCLLLSNPVQLIAKMQRLNPGRRKKINRVSKLGVDRNQVPTTSNQQLRNRFGSGLPDRGCWFCCQCCYSKFSSNCKSFMLVCHYTGHQPTCYDLNRVTGNCHQPPLNVSQITYIPAFDLCSLKFELAL